MKNLVLKIFFRIFFGIYFINAKVILHLFRIKSGFLWDFIWFYQLIGYVCFISGLYLIYQSIQNNTIKIKISSNQNNQQQVKAYENNQTIVKINAIISELSNLQQEFKDKNLNLDIFIKFDLLNDKFKTDLQSIQGVVGKLQTVGQDDNPSHVQLLNHYLDLFNEQKQIIYSNIQQQCNEELDTMANQLHNFNEIINKTV